MKTFLSIVVISLNVFISSYILIFAQNQTQSIQGNQSNTVVSQPPQFESLGLYLLQKKGGTAEQEYRQLNKLFADAAKAVQATTNSKSVEPFEFLGKLTLKNLHFNPRYLHALQENEAFSFPLQNITADFLRFLSKQGIYFLDSMIVSFSQRNTRTFSSVFLADGIVTGTVVDIKNDAMFADGYRTSIVIQIDDVFKGNFRVSDTVVLRKYGRTVNYPNNKKVYETEQFDEDVPELNKRYIFHLSKRIYEKRVLRPIPIENTVNRPNYLRYDDEIERLREKCYEGTGNELNESEINIVRLACQKYYQLKSQYNSEK